MSFRYAWEGIVSLFSNERNAQIQKEVGKGNQMDKNLF